MLLYLWLQVQLAERLQEAAAVLRSMEHHLERYAQAALFLGRRLPFHQLIQMTGVTQVLQGRAGRTETVLLDAPAWETTVPLHQCFGQVRAVCESCGHAFLNSSMFNRLSSVYSGLCLCIESKGAAYESASVTLSTKASHPMHTSLARSAMAQNAIVAAPVRLAPVF